MCGCTISDLDQCNVGLWQQLHLSVFVWQASEHSEPKVGDVACGARGREHNGCCAALLLYGPHYSLLWQILAVQIAKFTKVAIATSNISHQQALIGLQDLFVEQHFFIEFGLKMIQFKIQFKTKSKIFIQKNIHSIESKIFNRIIHSLKMREIIQNSKMRSKYGFWVVLRPLYR